jgi:hypothetical protein
MIRLSDALILAGTKLRTHRVRTTITIVLSSLLFAALIAVVIMAQGVTKSVTAFNSEGLNNRYIVWAQADSPFVGNVLGSSSVIALVKQKGEDLIIAKQAEAKKLGIDYNANNETPATITQTSPGYNPTEHINMQSYAVTEALQEYIKQHPGSSLDDLKQATASYHPTGFYVSTISALNGGDIKIMLSGNENFNPADDQRASL